MAPAGTKRCRSMGWVSLPLVMAVAAVVAACSTGQASTPMSSATVGKQLVTSPEVSAPSASATMNPASTQISSGDPTQKGLSTGHGRTVTVVSNSAFATPSGNIVCMMYAVGVDPSKGTTESDAVRCDAMTVTFKPPKKPADCPLDWDGSITLSARAQFLCHGDTVLGEARLGIQPTAWHRRGADATVSVFGASSAVLGYGSVMTAGTISCSVASSGVTCRNSRTGAWFSLARERYSISN